MEFTSPLLGTALQEPGLGGFKDTISKPYPNGGPLFPPGNSLGALNDVGFSAVGPVKNISKNTPYEQAWSFGFQKQLPWKIVAEANYVGKKGTHLYFGGFREM